MLHAKEESLSNAVPLPFLEQGSMRDLAVTPAIQRTRNVVGRDVQDARSEVGLQGSKAHELGVALPDHVHGSMPLHRGRSRRGGRCRAARVAQLNGVIQRRGDRRSVASRKNSKTRCAPGPTGVFTDRDGDVCSVAGAAPSGRPFRL